MHPTQFVFLGHEREGGFGVYRAHYKRLECIHGGYIELRETDAKGRSLSVLCISNDGAAGIKMAEHNRLLLPLCANRLSPTADSSGRYIKADESLRISLCVHLLRAQPSPKTPTVG